MDSFLALQAEERRQLCDDAADRLSLSAASIEKDLWVCWVLRELFALGEVGEHLTFKGGTSLSKAWKLIERFSEDLDVTVSRAFWGFVDDKDPAAAGSGKQRGRLIDELRASCEDWCRKILMPQLQERLAERLPEQISWDLRADPADPSGLTLLFRYPNGLSTSYVRPVVKIELGALSDTEPSSRPVIQPYLAEASPGLLPESSFSVRTVEPVRTFWEKAMLLHEEGFRASGVSPRSRLSRHYYDLWCLIQKGVAEQALEDPGLFERIAAHRAVFFRKNQEARDSLRPGSLHIRPRDNHRATWARDYRAMQESMFFGDSPTFDEIVRVVGDFERRFNEG